MRTQYGLQYPQPGQPHHRPPGNIINFRVRIHQFVRQRCWLQTVKGRITANIGPYAAGVISCRLWLADWVTSTCVRCGHTGCSRQSSVPSSKRVRRADRGRLATHRRLIDPGNSIGQRRDAKRADSDHPDGSSGGRRLAQRRQSAFGRVGWSASPAFRAFIAIVPVARSILRQ